MKKNILILVLGLTVISIETYARAGGASGSGGGYVNRYSWIITLSTTIIFLIILNYRNVQSKKQIKISGINDSLWNYEEILDWVKKSFLRVQNAWMEKDLSLVNDLITENLMNDLEKKIRHLNFINEKNVLEEIEIKSIKIIGCQDFIDNEKDSFIAYVRGSMIDYSISNRTGNITTNSSKRREKFMDLYYYKRHNNTWLIERIENKVTFRSLFKSKHILENR